MSGCLLPLIGLVALLAGCQPSIAWRYWLDDSTRDSARTEQKLMFVYLRNWASVECTDFVNGVLSEKRVVDATADMLCVQLEYAVPADQRLAESWGITRVPAVAIVDPSGNVIEKASGPLSAPDLLALIDRARQRYAPTTQSSARSR